MTTESYRAWRERNRDKINAQSRARYAKNGDKLRAAARVRFVKNYEKKTAQRRAWMAANPDYQRQMYRKHIVKVLWRSARIRAEKRGLAFDLTVEDIVIPSHCPVLGLPLHVSDGTGFRDHSPTIDRIDNAGGYVRGNIQVISWRANRIKCDATVDEMRKLLAYMEKITA